MCTELSILTFLFRGYGPLILQCFFSVLSVKESHENSYQARNEKICYTYFLLRIATWESPWSTVAWSKRLCNKCHYLGCNKQMKLIYCLYLDVSDNLKRTLIGTTYIPNLPKRSNFSVPTSGNTILIDEQDNPMRINNTRLAIIHITKPFVQTQPGYKNQTCLRFQTHR